MFGPDYTAGCPSCSAIADGFDGFVVHLANHDVMLCAVSRAPLAKLQAYKRRMGWSFPWASSFGSDFNYDFQAAYTEGQQQSGVVEYNFHAMDYGRRRVRQGESTRRIRRSWHGRGYVHTGSAGHERLRARGRLVYHTYSAYARGLDGLWGMYQWLDRAPRGRNESLCRMRATSAPASGTAAMTSTTASDAGGRLSFRLSVLDPACRVDRRPDRRDRIPGGTMMRGEPPRGDGQ